MDSAYHSSVFEYYSHSNMKVLQPFSKTIPGFPLFPNRAVSGDFAAQPYLYPSKQVNPTTVLNRTSPNSIASSGLPTSEASLALPSSPSASNELKQPRLSIPKSSYLLMKLEFPNFTKAASWDSISESYNNLTSKLVTGSKPKGKGAVFPYLMHLGLGVKYTECFEMQKSSHSMILHREQTMNQSRFKHYVFPRASRV